MNLECTKTLIHQILYENKTLKKIYKWDYKQEHCSSEASSILFYLFYEENRFQISLSRHCNYKLFSFKKKRGGPSPIAKPIDTTAI